MNIRLFLAICLAFSVAACNDSDDSPSMPVEDSADQATNAENDGMTVDDQSAGETTPPAGDISIEASVGRWSDTALQIDYRITNTGALELIVFDVGNATTTAVDDDGQITVFQAKRETGETDFAETPTIGGRNLSPGQTLDGMANRTLPISIDFVAPLVSGLAPDSITFCIGYGNADNIIPTTRADGTYPLNVDLELQSLVCLTLDRP